MKKDLLQPIAMTLIAIWSLRTGEKRAELLERNPILWLILFAFIVSWLVYFMQKHNKKKLK